MAWIAKNLDLGEGRDATWLVPFRDHTPEYRKSSSARHLELQYNPELDTHFAWSKESFSKDTEVLLILLHGIGAQYSNMGSMYCLQDLYNAIRVSQRKGTAIPKGRDPEAKMLVEYLDTKGITLASIPKIASVSFDLPGSGTGPSLSQFDSRDATMGYLAERVAAAKRYFFQKTGRKVPVVGVGRSASGSFVIEYALDQVLQANPETSLQGITPISPTHSEYDINVDSIETLLHEARAFNIPLHAEALQWFARLSESLTFDKTIRETGLLTSDIPFLLMTGDLDKQVSDTSRQMWKAIASAHPEKLRYHNSPHVFHDTLRFGTLTSSKADPDLIASVLYNHELFISYLTQVISKSTLL
jgi:pimeloyl-ACP methyl ester carboxylesterase